MDVDDRNGHSRHQHLKVVTNIRQQHRCYPRSDNITGHFGLIFPKLSSTSKIPGQFVMKYSGPENECFIGN